MKKLLVLLLIIVLGACYNNTESINKERTFLGYLQDEDGSMVLALNTEVYITTVKSSKKETISSSAQELLFEYHKILDGYHYYREDGQRMNNLKVLNESFGETLKVDEKLIDALEQAIILTKLTKGYFNPTIGKVSELYDGKFLPFETVNTDPDDTIIKQALETVVPYKVIDKYIIIDKDSKEVTLLPYDDNEYILDLGAFSKGYVIDKLYQELIKYESSFLLTTGSSSMVGYVNENEDVAWSIGVKDPENVSNVVFAFPMNNLYISCSGDYEQYYLLENGTHRHHILNPNTGYSENFYRQIVLTSKDGASYLDALSTALFSIDDISSIESIIQDINNYYNTHIDYCFMNKDYNLIINKDFKNTFIEGYTSNKIESIIER